MAKEKGKYYVSIASVIEAVDTRTAFNEAMYLNPEHIVHISVDRREEGEVIVDETGDPTPEGS